MPSAASNRISTQNGSQNEGIYYLTGQEWKVGQVLDQLDEQLNSLAKGLGQKHSQETFSHVL